MGILYKGWHRLRKLKWQYACDKVRSLRVGALDLLSPPIDKISPLNHAAVTEFLCLRKRL